MQHSPVLMHIPDGFLSLAISLLCWAITVIVLSMAIARTDRALEDRQVPLMGVMAAFIFAAQLINFPVAGGTSGHLLGGTLAAITLGPWAGMLVMTAVIAVQGLLFQDGGLLVMGANILNMGLLTTSIGYGLYRMVLGRGRTVRLAVAGLAAWLSVMAGALATSLQIWLSGNARLEIILPTMLAWHALIGIGEALITVAALSFILRTRPDVLGEGSPSASSGGGWAAAGVLIALSVVLLAPLASANPDGLTRVAQDLGFIGSAQSPNGPLAGYRLSWLGATPLSKIAAAAIGVLVVLVISVLVGRKLQRKG